MYIYTHTNGSHHIYEYLAHRTRPPATFRWRSTHVNKTCHTNKSSHVSRTNESRHTYEYLAHRTRPPAPCRWRNTDSTRREGFP